MENNGDSGNKEFQPGLCREYLSTKNNGYGTGNEDFLPDLFADDQSMGTNGYSTGNEGMIQPSLDFWDWNYSYTGMVPAGQGETKLDIDSVVSDQGSIEGSRRYDDPNSDAAFRRRANDRAYRQRSRATQERIKVERDNFEAENGQLKRQIKELKCEIQEKDELMKSTLERHGNEIKEKEREVEILQLKLEKVELEKMVMKAEVGRVEAEKKLLQRELAIANQSSQTQSSETDHGRHLE